MTNLVYRNYTKHYLSVDCVILGYEEEELKLLLYPRGFAPEQGKWSLLGGFVDEDETIDNAALRVLYNTTGLKEIYLEQVHSFSEPDRDPGARVVSMAYVALVKIIQQDKDLVREYGAHWWPLSKLPDLIFDHRRMVDKSIERLQQKASSQLIGGELLPEMFTLVQLRNLYNAIFQRTFDPGNFRRKVLSLDVLERLDIKDMSSSKKGAFYYRFTQKSLDMKFKPIFNLINQD
jgi:8-oxo-dGTP diphosphatase